MARRPSPARRRHLVTTYGASRASADAVAELLIRRTVVADIGIRPVTKRYRNGQVASDGVDLDVADGELLVLVGPSGCGKSTLFRMVAGLEEVTAGDPHRRTGRTYAAPKDRNIAMVFQSYALYPHRTVRGTSATR